MEVIEDPSRFVMKWLGWVCGDLCCMVLGLIIFWSCLHVLFLPPTFYDLLLVLHTASSWWLTSVAALLMLVYTTAGYCMWQPDLFAPLGCLWMWENISIWKEKFSHEVGPVRVPFHVFLWLLALSLISSKFVKILRFSLIKTVVTPRWSYGRLNRYRKTAW